MCCSLFRPVVVPNAADVAPPEGPGEGDKDKKRKILDRLQRMDDINEIFHMEGVSKESIQNLRGHYLGASHSPPPHLNYYE